MSAMATELLLDTLNPPAPDQLVRDCEAVGAAGCWVYILRRAADGTDVGVGRWTPAHAGALRAAGKRAPGIVVPGNVPPPVQDVIAAARSMGVDPVVGGDFETASEPPTTWEDELDQACAAAGIRELNYGPASVLGQYDPGEAGWLAEWIRTGVLQPLPALKTGWLAWQFVNDILVNGTTYDASVVDPSVFGGDMDADEHNALMNIQGLVTSAWQFLERGYDDPPAGSPPGTPATHDSILLGMSYLRGEANASLSRIEQALAALKQPVADPAALATALTADPAFVEAIAKAVVSLEAAKLSAP